MIVYRVSARDHFPPDRELARFNSRRFDRNENVEGKSGTGELALVETVTAKVEG